MDNHEAVDENMNAVTLAGETSPPKSTDKRLVLSGASWFYIRSDPPHGMDLVAILQSRNYSVCMGINYKLITNYFCMKKKNNKTNFEQIIWRRTSYY